MLVIIIAAGTTFNMLFASTNNVQTGTAVNMWTVIIRSNNSAIVKTYPNSKCVLSSMWGLRLRFAGNVCSFSTYVLLASCLITNCRRCRCRFRTHSRKSKFGAAITQHNVALTTADGTVDAVIQYINKPRLVGIKCTISNNSVINGHLCSLQISERHLTSKKNPHRRSHRPLWQHSSS